MSLSILIKSIQDIMRKDDLFSLERVNVGPAGAQDPAPDPQPPVGKKPKAGDKETPTIEQLAEKGSPDIRALFGELRERIRTMDEQIIERPTSFYVAYRLSKNFAEIQIQKNQINISLRPTDYVDPRNLVEKLPDSYNWTMDRRVYLSSANDLDYVCGLIEQSYQTVL